jgi:hypothetical protein
MPSPTKTVLDEVPAQRRIPSIARPATFSGSLSYISSGKAGVKPYTPDLPINQRHQRGFRVACGKLTGWVWNSPLSERIVQTDLLTLVVAATNAADNEDLVKMLLTHLSTVNETTELPIAQTLAANLLFALEPLDIEGVAQVLGISKATAERRLSTGALPPPVFHIDGEEVWSLWQWIQIGRKHVSRVPATGREHIDEDGGWREGTKNRVQLCDILAEVIYQEDFDRFLAIGDEIVEKINAPSSLRQIRQIAADICTLLPLIGVDDVVQLDLDDDAIAEGPPPLFGKTGRHIWYRAQFPHTVEPEG